MESIGKVLRGEIRQVQTQLDRQGELQRTRWVKGATDLIDRLHAIVVGLEDAAPDESARRPLRQLRIELEWLRSGLDAPDPTAEERAGLQAALDRLRTVATDTLSVPFPPDPGLPQIRVSFAPGLRLPFNAGVLDEGVHGDGQSRDEALVNLARALTNTFSDILPPIVRGDAERTLSLVRALAEPTNFA